MKPTVADSPAPSQRREELRRAVADQEARVAKLDAEQVVVRQRLARFSKPAQFGFRIRPTSSASIKNPWLRYLMWRATHEWLRDQRNRRPSNRQRRG